MSKPSDAWESPRKKSPFCWWQAHKLNSPTIFLHRKVLSILFPVKTEHYFLCVSLYILSLKLPFLQLCSLRFSLCTLNQITPVHSPYLSALALLCGVCMCVYTGAYILTQQLSQSLGISLPHPNQGLIWNLCVCVHTLFFVLVHVWQFHFNTCLKNEGKKKKKTKIERAA